MSKTWYKSKTLWVNAIAIAGILMGATNGVDPELQVGILAAINFIIRLITKEALEW